MITVRDPALAEYARRLPPGDRDVFLHHLTVYCWHVGARNGRPRDEVPHVLSARVER